MDKPFEWSLATKICLVEALEAAHAIIERATDGKPPRFNDIENYVMAMRAAMGPDYEGVLIHGFLEDIREELYAIEEKPGTANASPKARKRTPEVKKK